MLNRNTYHSVKWVDIEAPSEREITEVMREFSLHPVLADELVTKSYKPRFEIYNNCIYVVLHFPVRTHIKGKYFFIEKEVDFIVGKDFIITTKYDSVEPLQNFSKIFEVNSILDKSDSHDNAGIVFYHMLKRLYSNLFLELEGVKDELKGIESDVFKSKEKEMVVKISNTGREIIDFNQTIKSHSDVIKDLTTSNLSEFFGKEYRYYMLDIQAFFEKIVDTAQNHKELLNDLRETNDSLLSTKQNETMKLLTLMAFVTFPLSLFLDIFGIRSSHTPIIGSSYDFEIIVGLMLVGALSMFLYFRWRKWL